MRSFIALLKTWVNKLIGLFKKNANPDDPSKIDPDDIQKPGPDIVCYYGCPNSNKAKKLQLSKNLYR